MADPYRRYAPVSADRVSAQKASFPGHLSSEASTLTTSQPWNSNDLRGSSDFLLRDNFPLGNGSYGGDGLVNIRSGHGVDGLVTSAGIQRYPSPTQDQSLLSHWYGVDGLVSSAGAQRYPSPAQDRSFLSQRHGVDGLVTSADIQRYPSATQNQSLLSQRHEAAPGRSPRISDIPQMHSSLTMTNGTVATSGESNILFVGGLPTDCSRREVGHLFRPFIGFKEIKVVHKEARRKGDKPKVLCFVEFADAKCALTAMEALQGYKFDDKKPESPVFEICFAHFPFLLPDHKEHQLLGAIR